MKRYQSTAITTIAILALVALAAVIYTRDWVTNQGQPGGLETSQNASANPVDMRPLKIAQQLAQLAVTPTEQEFAKQALRLADNSVDLAFAAAVHDATENPVPRTPVIQQLTERIKAGEAAVAADENRITQYTAVLVRANGASKDALQELIGVAQAQLTLDQDDLDDAHQDLIRAGGDKQATIQQLLDQHKSSTTQNAGPSQGATGTSPSIELLQLRNVAGEIRQGMSLRSKEDLLTRARSDAETRAAKLSNTHNAIEKQLEDGKTQSAGVASGSRPALSILQNLTEGKKSLTDFDKRIEIEQQLAVNYGNWIEFVKGREKATSHELLVSMLWILLVLLTVLSANYLVQHFFSGVERERRILLTLRALILFLVQAFGTLCILLIIFGIPGNFGTVLALIGAGLTVAMKDFIVGFFGWFVLMGKNGIRPGDWVEINGVGGEVVQVGFLHTVLLETGNWTDAGHPTGRKVSFVNSFAIEGHYFNFSTSGQWLWDEIEMQIPESVEPYAIAEAIQEIATRESGANAQLAEEEWNRVTPSGGKRAFSAEPSLSVRPAATGIKIVLRYITRANERYAVRVRLYRAIVELLHKKTIPESAVTTPAPELHGE